MSNPLHVDAMTLHRDSYNEPKIVIWEEGEFKQPIALLSAHEATNLRDELNAALKRLPKAPCNSWFMEQARMVRGTSRARLAYKWCGDPGQWREWLAANAILRRLKKLRRRK